MTRITKALLRALIPCAFFASSVVATERRERFEAPTVEIANECDAILDRLEARYGTPKHWKRFPVYFRPYKGDGVAGYTAWSAPNVVEVVVYESLDSSRGGTLDHELTHAFFFYFVNSNFDLMFNEGAAQNSEYRRRAALRQTVYSRRVKGDFWDLNRLYGRNEYDDGLRIYHEGFSVVDFLIARGGSRWFAAFLDDLVATQDVDESLRRYYGYKDLNAFQTEWLKYVDGGQDRRSVAPVGMRQ